MNGACDRCTLSEILCECEDAMDTKTRAEKIANNWMNHPANIEALTEEITSQLDEAVLGAFDSKWKNEHKRCLEIEYAKGFAAAKKKAAGICYLAGHKIQGLRGDLRGPFAFHLGESIRNMSETSMEA